MEPLNKETALQKIRELPVNEDKLGHCTLKITTLDKDKKPISDASAFIVSCHDGPYLYTCWHVVTGIDFFDPKLPLGKDTPSHLLVTGVNVHIQYAMPATPGGPIELTEISCGSTQQIEVPLYDQDQRPLWEQQAVGHRENGILNDCGIYIPEALDVVRIPIDLPSELETIWTVDPQRCGATLGLFSEVVVSGYPYGFSTSSNSIMPVFLKRSVASRKTDIYDTYLDGGCSPCMSGGPVWSSDKKLAGIYRGIRFPDSVVAAIKKRENDRHAALGLMTDYLHFGDLGNPSLPPNLKRW